MAKSRTRIDVELTFGGIDDRAAIRRLIGTEAHRQGWAVWIEPLWSRGWPGYLVCTRCGPRRLHPTLEAAVVHAAQLLDKHRSERWDEVWRSVGEQLDG